jgi:Signal transduction histidine kinase
MPADETARLRQALAAQTELQREADHRVKNTFQLISSLILLQGRRAPYENTRQALASVQRRVIAVAAAHRNVSRESGVEQVDLAVLVRELAGAIAGVTARDGVDIALDLAPIVINARDAAPLALIVNELLGNALSHAFPDGRGGRVTVTLQASQDGFDLTVADDGVGAPGGGPVGFGRTIVQLLAQQLHATLSTVETQPGLRVTVSVPVDLAQP